MENRHPVLAYDKLVEAYLANLTTAARGFQAAEAWPFLAAWVPDDDPQRGVIDVVEAAAEAGLEAVTVRLAQGTHSAVDVDALAKEAARIGDVELVRSPDAALTVRFRGASHLAIAPPYRARLAEVLRRCTHEGEAAPQDGLLVVRTCAEGTTLSAAVDPTTHVVRRAAHQGSPSEVARGLLEALCVAIEGIPVQDASDHGVLAVEARLRTGAPAVAGIVMPENADLAFELPLRLARGLLAEYRRASGYDRRENAYGPPVAREWLALSAEERTRRVGAAIEACGGTQGLRLVRLEDAERVVLAWEAVPDRAGLPALLRRVERHLRETLEPGLQVHGEPKADGNAVRVKKEVRP